MAFWKQGMKSLCFLSVTIAVDANGLVALFAKHPEQAGRRGTMKGVVTFQGAHGVGFQDGSSLLNPIKVIPGEKGWERHGGEEGPQRVARAPGDSAEPGAEAVRG